MECHTKGTAGNVVAHAKFNRPTEIRSGSFFARRNCQGTTDSGAGPASLSFCDGCDDAPKTSTIRERVVILEKTLARASCESVDTNRPV